MTIAFEKLSEIFAPLDTLLASGGDTRLQLDPTTRLNGYGCRPYPRPEAYTFASSTATSISARAFAQAEAVRHDLIRSALRVGLDGALDELAEAQRRQLKALLAFGGMGVSVVFSPSGTDAALQALFVARALGGTPLTSIIVASDETGSGVAHAACGRHFNSLTAHGAAVETGKAIAGLAEDLAIVPVPLHEPDGSLRSSEAMDEAVLGAVAEAIAAGHRVLLHAMDHSKLGNRSPSLGCLREITRRWRERVQVVVDACQLRLGRARLRWHLDQEHMVLITGSKFFTGPPFSGALLVPRGLSRRMAGATPSAGLVDYTSRSDWPGAWRGMRDRLRERTNLGQMLRWAAALEEMRAFFAVPADYRRAALGEFATIVSAMIAREPALELLAAPEPPAAPRAADEEEMAVRTIFPFFVRRAGKLLSVTEAQHLYRALNEDLSQRFGASASAAERQLAARLCHIGQPVAVPHASFGMVGALRISAGARVVSETWDAAGEAASRQRLAAEIAQVRVILDKIALVLRHGDAMQPARGDGKAAA